MDTEPWAVQTAVCSLLSTPIACLPIQPEPPCPLPFTQPLQRLLPRLVGRAPDELPQGFRKQIARPRFFHVLGVHHSALCQLSAAARAVRFHRAVFS